MHYFVGINIPLGITGVERAMFNRLYLFKKYNIPAKLLFTDFLPFFNHHAEIYHVAEDTLYMYDYFQNATGYQKDTSIDWLSHWENVKGYSIGRIGTSNDFACYKEGRIKLYARFYDNEHQNLQYINYYGDGNRLIKRDMFDYRGFLSCSYCFDHEGKEFLQNIYNTQGETVIQKFFNTAGERSVLERILLKEKNDMFESFVSEEAFVAYFIEQLYQPGDHFIIDRPMELVPAFIQVDSSIPASVFMHTTLFLDMYDPSKENIVFTYHSLFQNLNRFESLIVSTKAQKMDIEARVPDTVKVYNIPVGFVKNEPYIPKYNHKSSMHLLSIARYAEGKQIEHQIRLIHKLKDEFPNIKLNCYGYGSHKPVLEALIQKLNLENHVILNDFKTDLSDVYQHASVALFTSRLEGFALSILECLTHDTPVIAYDIKYGPNEMIKDGINGNLVERNNEVALYETVRQYLIDEAIQQKYYQNCRPSIVNFDETHMIQKWHHFIDKKA